MRSLLVLPRLALLLLASIFIAGCYIDDGTPVSLPAWSKVERIELFESYLIDDRDIYIYLPEPYIMEKVEADGKFMRFPVVYAHDGQNLFEAGNSFGGEEWGLDEALDSLIRSEKIRPTIVVGISNTAKRYQEYMPAKPEGRINELVGTAFSPSASHSGAEIISDEYLKFIVEELKPYIDKQYPTLSGAQDTYLMGSSMGGLISAYGLCEYPEVFSRAACLSTHWPALDGVFLEYLAENLPSAGLGKRFYFDHGTVNLDSTYAPFQLRADSIFSANGYLNAKVLADEADKQLGLPEGVGTFQTYVIGGADHNEVDWRARLPEVLKFLGK